MPTAYAEENTPEVTATSSAASETAVNHEFTVPDYQGKQNLKEYWDAVQNYRTEISDMREKFEVLEPTDEMWAQVDELIASAQDESDLTDLESVKTELNGLLDSWTEEALAALGVDTSTVASGYQSQGGGASYYEYAVQSGVLTRSGGVNYYGGRTETWYSQRVLPGGGLDIPGRHVAEDGTIRDADGYIVVAASDLPYGTTIDTSLGQGKVYDNGCAAGTTDIYTDW